MSTISLNHYLECTLQVFVFHTTQREETHKRLSIPPNGKLEAVPFTIRHQCRAAERNLFKERHFRKRAKEGRRGRKELGEGRSSIDGSVFSDLKSGLGGVRTLSSSGDRRSLSVHSHLTRCSVGTKHTGVHLPG